MKKIILAMLVSAVSLSASASNSPMTSNLKMGNNTFNGVVLPNGVVVNHIKPGTGAKPTSTSTVKVNYQGRFADGRIFDESKAPIEFRLDRVIPCWTTGLQQVKVGGSVSLKCPSATAYGSRGAGDIIKPNTDLFFDVELISIK